MKQPTVLIIGAGIGGLGTAIQLARAGCKVTIVEKNDHPGGRCQQINKDGHLFDTGPTMYLFPGLFTSFFSSIGEDINDHLKLLPCDPTYRLNFADNTDFILSPSKEHIKQQLETVEPGSAEQFEQFLKDTRKHYEFALKKITLKDFKYPWQYFTLPNLYFALKNKALKPHYEFTREYFKDPHLNAVFTFQDSYLGLDPFHTQALFSLLFYTEFKYGNYLPESGMYKIIEVLEKIARKNNVTIQYNKVAKQIQTQNNRATGVLFEDSLQQSADYIIANADLSYTYNVLLKDDPYAQKLKQKKYSCSVIVYHWGTDKEYPQLNTHNIFFSEDYHQGFDQVLNQLTPPPNPHFYIQAPSRTDPTRAPTGQDTLSVMVPINHLDPKTELDWKEYSTQLKEYIFRRLTQAGIPELEKHIKFEIRYTPPDWQRYLNLTNGSVYGLDHTITQIGYLRPHRQHSHYKNLFFVGSSTHPGSGLPTVLLSSQFTAQRVIEYIKKK